MGGTGFVAGFRLAVRAEARLAGRAGFLATLRAAVRDAVFGFAVARLVDRVPLPFRAVAFFFVARGDIPRPFLANLSPPAAAPRRAKVTNRLGNGQAGCGGQRADSKIRSFGRIAMPLDGVEHVPSAHPELLGHFANGVPASDLR